MKELEENQQKSDSKIASLTKKLEKANENEQAAVAAAAAAKSELDTARQTIKELKAQLEQAQAAQRAAASAVEEAAAAATIKLLENAIRAMKGKDSEGPANGEQ